MFLCVLIQRNKKKQKKIISKNKSRQFINVLILQEQKTNEDQRARTRIRSLKRFNTIGTKKKKKRIRELEHEAIFYTRFNTIKIKKTKENQKARTEVSRLQAF